MQNAIWTKCRGEAHNPAVAGNIDHCGRCAPFWGSIASCPHCNVRQSKLGRTKCPGCGKHVIVDRNDDTTQNNTSTVANATQENTTMTARTTTEPLARRIQHALSAMGLTATIDTEGRGRNKSYKVTCDGATQAQMDKAQDAATAADEHTAAAPTPAPAVPAAVVPTVVAPAATPAPVAAAAAAAAVAVAVTEEEAQLKLDLVTMAAECVRVGQSAAARHIEAAIKAIGSPATEVDIDALLKMHHDAGGSMNFGKVNKYRATWIAARDGGLVIYSWPDRSKGAPAAMSVLTDAGKAKLGLLPARTAGRRATDKTVDATPPTAPTAPVTVAPRTRGRRSA